MASPQKGINLGPGVNIDLIVLMASRMLVQANSGAGKSWMLRRMLEQTAGKVQQIVIDPEGEFSTLREKHDYIIAAAHDGDVLASPATAKLLALKLLETGVSAIIDIYDLKTHERQAFVRIFLDALVNAPKKYWKHVMVVLDEAHIFAPQVSKSESLGAVIDIATRGRKRGQCLVCATQRLSKLHKDVAAELLNKVIGRCNLDLDVKRAADELGMTAIEARKLFRRFDPGDFMCYGPALTNDVVKTRVGAVRTTHPKPGDRFMEVPPASSKAIKKILAGLVDLPKEAELEARSVAEYKQLVSTLKRELTRAKNARPGVPEAEVQQRIKEAVKEMKHLPAKPLASGSEEKMRKALKSVALLANNALKENVIIKPTKPQLKIVHDTPAEQGSGSMSRPQQKIIDAVAYLNAIGIPQPNRTQVAAVAGYRKSGGFNNNISALNTCALLFYPMKGHVELSDEGRDLASKVTIPDDADEAMHEAWFKLISSPQQKLLSVIISRYPNSISREDLAIETGYQQSGGFNNNVSKLNTLGAINYPQQGFVCASYLLFPNDSKAS